MKLKKKDFPRKVKKVLNSCNKPSLTVLTTFSAKEVERITFIATVWLRRCPRKPQCNQQVPRAVKDSKLQILLLDHNFFFFPFLGKLRFMVCNFSTCWNIAFSGFNLTSCLICLLRRINLEYFRVDKCKWGRDPSCLFYVLGHLKTCQTFTSLACLSFLLLFLLNIDLKKSIGSHEIIADFVCSANEHVTNAM